MKRFGSLIIGALFIAVPLGAIAALLALGLR